MGRTETALSLERVLAYDVRPKSVQSFARDMRARFDLEVEPVDDPRQAVSGWAGPILKKPQAGWLETGAFASLVDFGSFWHQAVMNGADKTRTDDVPQLMYDKQMGHFHDTPPIHADLGELVADLRPGRESGSERTLVCNLGLAMDDMAVTPDRVSLDGCKGDRQLVISLAPQRDVNCILPACLI